ncbi:MAG: SIS domain-containing protein [Clostridia bacterium]|nr:SIS domain-containing protein [Clostridia bacterium]
MKESTRNILIELGERYPALQPLQADIAAAFEMAQACFERGGRLYLCGNGGSASDCEHIVGELMKSFKKKRPLSSALVDGLEQQGEEGRELLEYLDGGLPAVSLCGHPALSTAFINDKNPLLTFAQQLSVWGEKGDVLLTLSTSGNSKNCVLAAAVARAKGMQVLFLGGGNGGKLKGMSDVSIIVPEKETYKVQELHLPVYHCLCAMLEEENF